MNAFCVLCVLGIHTRERIPNMIVVTLILSEPQPVCVVLTVLVSCERRERVEWARRITDKRKEQKVKKAVVQLGTCQRAEDQFNQAVCPLITAGSSRCSVSGLTRCPPL